MALSRAKCQAFKSILDSSHTLVPKNTLPFKLIMWKKQLYNSGYMFSETTLTKWLVSFSKRNSSYFLVLRWLFTFISASRSPLILHPGPLKYSKYCISLTSNEDSVLIGQIKLNIKHSLHSDLSYTPVKFCDCIVHWQKSLPNQTDK